MCGTIPRIFIKLVVGCLYKMAFRNRNRPHHRMSSIEFSCYFRHCKIVAIGSPKFTFLGYSNVDFQNFTGIEDPGIPASSRGDRTDWFSTSTYKNPGTGPDFHVVIVSSFCYTGFSSACTRTIQNSVA